VSDEPFDKALQDQRFASMKEFLPELLDLYRKNVGPTLDKVRQALTDGDLKGAGKAAHTLKGMSAVVCAQAVQNVAAELETAARKDETQALPNLLARLEDQVDKTIAHLNATLPGPE